MTPKPRIVVVDDKPIRAKILARLLKDMGYEVCGVVDSGEKALELVQYTNPDLILIDIQLVGAIDAIEAATHIQTGWDVGVVYMFSSADDALWERSKRVEPVGYLMRPFGETELRYVIEMAQFYHRRNRDMKESEQTFRTMIDAAPYGIALIDREGVCEYVNPRFTEMFGYTCEDVSHWDFWVRLATPRRHPQADKLPAWSEYQETSCAESKRDFHVVTVRSRDGTERKVSVSVTGLGEGKLVCTYRDVTEDLAAKERILRAKDWWERTFNAVSDGIMILDTDYKILRMNQAMARLVSLDSEQAVGKKCYELVHARDTPPPDCPHVKLLGDSQEHRSELYEERFGMVLDVRVSPIWNGDNKLFGSVHLVRDVTDIKRLEKELWQAIVFQKKLLNTAATAIFLVDTDRRVVAINEAFRGITGYDEQDIIGKTCDTFTLDPCQCRCGLFGGATTDRLSRVECAIRTKNGQVLRVLKNATLLKDSRDRVTGGIESFIDVTDLVEARIAAEHAAKVKSEFLSIISHELRTPLNAILGFSELLLEQITGPLNETQAAYVKNILESGEHMLRLFDDLVDLAKSESGKMQLHKEPVSISTLIDESLVMIKGRAKQGELGLEVSLAPDVVHLEIPADYVKLKQVLLNLLANATKFTPEGGMVRVTAERCGDELMVSVSDTGIGLSPEDMERIFESFEQVDTSYTRKYRGVGLGLTLARRLVELHGGRIWAESEGEGKGSTFRFTIPIEEAAQETA